MILQHTMYCYLKKCKVLFMKYCCFFVAFSFEQEKFLVPRWICRFHHHISNAPLVMLDANLPPDSLAAACMSKLSHLKVCRERV